MGKSSLCFRRRSVITSADETRHPITLFSTHRKALLRFFPDISRRDYSNISARGTPCSTEAQSLQWPRQSAPLFYVRCHCRRNLGIAKLSPQQSPLEHV